MAFLRSLSRPRLLPVLGLALGLLGAWPAASKAQSSSEEEQGLSAAAFETLSPMQLAAMLQKKDFTFVNVHIPYEGEIKNTDAFIPYDKIAENLGELPTDKSAPVVLYCRSGRMSEIAARELAQLGYTQVSHLSGGMIAWKNNGYPIIEK